MIYLDESHRLYILASQVAAMASAVFRFNEDKDPTELEIHGIWSILIDISKELYEASGWKEIDDESEKEDAE